MKFAIDAHAIGQKLTGNETYIRNLLKGFAALDQESEFLALVSVDHAVPHIPKGFQVGRVSTNPYLRLGWQIHAQMKAWQPDMLHVQYTAPLRTRVPVVVSVHDVSYLESPEFFSRYRSTQLKITVKRTVEKAAHIMTPSEFSRQAVAKWYNLDPERITVVHNAVDGSFRPVPREAAAAWLLRNKGVAWPYVLTVGDLQPRKNHIGLIRAFESVMREHPQLTHRLVITGKDTWFSGEIRAAAQASSVADRIVFTGFVNDDELHHYYSGCEVFVYPSFYEGLKDSYDALLYQQEVLGQYVNRNGNVVYSSFDHDEHVKPAELKRWHPVLWSLDFNVNPMSSVVAQHHAGVTHVLGEIVMPFAKTFDACDEFLRRYGKHEGGVEIFGDASGSSEHTTGDSDFEVVRQRLEASGVKATFRVPKANPRVRERINLVNSRLKTAAGRIELLIDPSCVELVKDFEQVTYRDGSGEIDKERDRSRTHVSDALGYLLCELTRPVGPCGEQSRPLF